MDWDEDLSRRLDGALNESTVCGFSFDVDRDEARLLLEVNALPEIGPIDPDMRRVLIFRGIADVSVIVRREEEQLGPVMPVGSLGEVDDLFARMQWIDEMYGWEFFDTPGPRDVWFDEPSLVIPGPSPQADHVLRWFAECGVGRGVGAECYAVQGIVRFNELHVERAGGIEMPVSRFADEGARWWRAFNDRDPRLSAEAQRAANAAAIGWRQQTGESTIVPAGPWGGA